jgi:cytochrome c oxidase subunit 1
MLVLTLPWHLTGIQGMPRRMAYYDYTNPEIAAQALPVVLSVAGALVVLASGVLFVAILLRAHRAPRTEPVEYRFSVAVHQSETLPRALNGFRSWLALMIALTLFNYGYPVVLLLTRAGTSVPAIPVTRGGSHG